MKSLIVRFVREEQGQDLIEYALLATFISIVAAAGATLAGNNLLAWYNALAGQVATMSAIITG